MSSLLVHTAASRGIQPSQSRGLLRFEQPLVCAMGSVVVGEITHLAHPMPSNIRMYIAVCLLMGCRRCCSCQKPCISKVRQPCLAMSAHASSLGRLSWSPPGPDRAPPGPHCIPTWSPLGPRSGWSTLGPHVVVPTWSPPGPHLVPTGSPHLVPTVSPPRLVSTWSPPGGPHVVPTWPHLLPTGPHLVPTGSPRGPHVVPTWSPRVFRLGTRREFGGGQVGST
jgi:hypothetical protein